jgi:ribosomal 50S subunit-recycling heat shock protein
VKAGDEIAIRRRDRQTLVQVTSVPETKNVSKASAGELYKLIEETNTDEGLV